MHGSQPEARDQLTVEISRDLEDIVPIFLENRKRDIQILRNALTTQDFRTVQTLGHRMKGDGGGFGFDRITEIGAAMERAAKLEDRSTIEQHIAQLEDFLKRVAVVYR
ncbi:MAG: Hpt domain-containing protein [Nitrospirota bacterium]|jgi:HPt (histidine-containing phosphotransfer) domain-containing protein